MHTSASTSFPTPQSVATPLQNHHLVPALDYLLEWQLKTKKMETPGFFFFVADWTATFTSSTQVYSAPVP